ALTRRYAVKDLGGLYKGPLLYCKDAFEGLDAMDRIVSGGAGELQNEQKSREIERDALAERAVKPAAVEASKDRSDVPGDNPVPIPPFWGRREVAGIPLDHMFSFVNPQAL